MATQCFSKCIQPLLAQWSCCYIDPFVGIGAELGRSQGLEAFLRAAHLGQHLLCGELHGLAGGQRAKWTWARSSLYVELSSLVALVYHDLQATDLAATHMGPAECFFRAA